MYILIPDFLTTFECDDLIKTAETAGLTEAKLYTPDGAEVRSDYRSNDRFMFDAPDMAAKLYARFTDELPNIKDAGKSWEPTGLNERFKVYRYKPGQFFALHTDHPYERNENEQSFFTLLLALNEEYVGGETNFLSMPVEHKTGQAVVFPHHLLHEGCPVDEGTKYMLRTDVMYKRTPLNNTI